MVHRVLNDSTVGFTLQHYLRENTAAKKVKRKSNNFSVLASSAIVIVGCFTFLCKCVVALEKRVKIT